MTEGSLATLMGMTEESVDAREGVLKEVAKILYDEAKIYMVARLSRERTEHIIKNVIVLTFYQKFYKDLKPETIRLTKDNLMKCLCKRKCSFCNGKPLNTETMYAKTVANEKILEEKFKDYFEQFIKDMLKLTVSEDGAGRKEAVQIVLNQQQQLDKERILEQRRGGII